MKKLLASILSMVMFVTLCCYTSATNINSNNTDNIYSSSVPVVNHVKKNSSNGMSTTKKIIIGSVIATLGVAVVGLTIALIHNHKRAATTSSLLAQTQNELEKSKHEIDSWKGKYNESQEGLKEMENVACRAIDNETKALEEARAWKNVASLPSCPSKIIGNSSIKNSINPKTDDTDEGVKEANVICCLINGKNQVIKERI